MSFLKGMSVMKEAIGGIYLKDQDAEQVIADLWKLIFLRSRQFLPDEPRSRALEAMENGESLVRFRARFRNVSRLGWRPVGDFQELAYGFRRWLARGFWDREFFYLWTLRLILVHEANRPHERWYGESREFPWRGQSREVSNLEALKVSLSGLMDMETEAGERLLAYLVSTTGGKIELEDTGKPSLL